MDSRKRVSLSLSPTLYACAKSQADDAGVPVTTYIASLLMREVLRRAGVRSAKEGARD